MMAHRHYIWISVVILVLAAAVITLIGNAGTDEKVSHHGVFVDAGNSKLCISCHDGTISHNVRFCTANCDVAREHSIFRTYPPKGKEREFVPANIVRARGIVIENGQVTCISCHNIKSPGRFHLAMSNTKSQLCLACHIR